PLVRWLGRIPCWCATGLVVDVEGLNAANRIDVIARRCPGPNVDAAGNVNAPIDRVIRHRWRASEWVNASVTVEHIAGVLIAVNVGHDSACDVPVGPIGWLCADDRL